jgi:dUTP pyrophosphatase
MKIQIKRIDKALPLPLYQTQGSVGFDFICREKIVVDPHSMARIPGNVVVKVPEGYMLMVVARSSTPGKYGLLIPNSVGIIDQDYNGPEDEIKIQVLNILDEPAVVERGERIAQGIFVKIEKAEWEEFEHTDGSYSRGGFGSTG